MRDLWALDPAISGMMSTLTAVSLFSAGMTGVITGLMTPERTRDAFRASVVDRSLSQTRVCARTAEKV